MEAKYEARKEELLDECTVAPQIFERVMPCIHVNELAFADSDRSIAGPNELQNLVFILNPAMPLFCVTFRAGGYDISCNSTTACCYWYDVVKLRLGRL